MKQLFQDPQAGKIEIVDIPEPAVQAGFLVVRNACSVISPGTERLAVSAARSSYLKTARERPDLVRRVLDTVKREGVLAAYRKVKTKLSEPQALGYASAGTVMATGAGAEDQFRRGDRVACMGAGYASHAEVVALPVNLAARIPEGVSFESAAFGTLGAIALQGVRQAEPTLGERVGVVGLGILGLLTVQILRSAGVRVAAFDLAPDLVEHARALGAETGVAGGTEDQVQTALAWSDGVGLDAVLVTAASKSDAPMVSAAGMCRDRGRVVAVGFVPFGLPREVAYAKELDLRISRSYGPGRYDPGFEEKGLDYPVGYVRWTETRNLEAFLGLLGQGNVTVEPLITHRVDLDAAPRAYDDLVAGGSSRTLGMVISYPEAPETPVGSKPAARPGAPGAAPVDGTVGVGFIGAGSFARAVLLPVLKNAEGVGLQRVATARGLTAHDARRKFGFREIGTDPREVLDDPAVNLVCIATRHDLHADLVVRALRAGKNVFVEKPLALNEEELREIEAAAAGSPGLLLVGFNRRFSPMVRAIREAVATRGPLSMICRVNAGALPAGHWLNDPEVGGGRMIGEGCHFVDLLSFLAGDPGIEAVDSRIVGRGRPVAEDFAVQVAFADGSVGQILYASGGDPALGKEWLEVHGGGASAVLDDYRRCRIVKGGRSSQVKKAGKGHAQELHALIDAVRSGGPSPVPLDVLAEVTRATFEAHRLQTAPGRD